MVKKKLPGYVTRELGKKERRNGRLRCPSVVEAKDTNVATLIAISEEAVGAYDGEPSPPGKGKTFVKNLFCGKLGQKLRPAAAEACLEELPKSLNSKTLFHGGRPQQTLVAAKKCQSYGTAMNPARLATGRGAPFAAASCA